MTVHFICRGNTFRSIIAEAYLKSLELEAVDVLSSGTVAVEHKVSNKINFTKTLALLERHGIKDYAKLHHADQLSSIHQIPGDVVVCMNQIVFDETATFGKLPNDAVVWNITDIGEGKRVPQNEGERLAYMEDVYQEIVTNVDELVNRLNLRRG